jgi:hypothetical protein
MNGLNDINARLVRALDRWDDEELDALRLIIQRSASAPDPTDDETTSAAMPNLQMLPSDGVPLLLRALRQPVSSNDRFGESLAYLFLQHGADPNAVDPHGFDGLALICDALQLADMRMTADFEPISSRLSVQSWHYEAAGALLDYGAKPTRDTVRPYLRFFTTQLVASRRLEDYQLRTLFMLPLLTKLLHVDPGIVPSDISDAVTSFRIPVQMQWQKEVVRNMMAPGAWMRRRAVVASWQQLRVGIFQVARVTQSLSPEE